ncbi:hypothetical protein JMM51_17440 [Rhodovulum sulfidophilum]|nr:hypothetical protein [Rhodovulum sulfidophilum]
MLMPLACRYASFPPLGTGGAALIMGLQAVDHATVDAACDAGHLRNLIERDLGAEPRTQANPPCAIKPPRDPCLHTARHKIENFFPRLKRFRRIVRCS